MNVVLHSSRGCIQIWLYPEKSSRKLRSLQPDALSTRVSILGSGYESFEHALFISVKSTHILHFPLAFLTNTTFANHLGYWISLMWPTLNNFWVSFWMTRCLSSLNFLRLCRTGLTFGSIVKRWHRKSGLMLGMSEAEHTKASKCHVITTAIWSCTSWLKDLPSLNLFPLISLSSTSLAGSSRLSRAIPVRATPSPSWGWLVIEHISHTTSLSPSGRTWW